MDGVTVELTVEQRRKSVHLRSNRQSVGGTEDMFSSMLGADHQMLCSFLEIS